MKRITSVKNDLIRRVHALQQSTRRRFKEKLMVVEGYRLVQELLNSGLPLNALFITTESLKSAQFDAVQPDCEIYEVSEQAFQKMTDTESPQGILALCPIPEIPIKTQKPALYVIADQVRDPGNMGTILRTAWAVGVDAVFLLPGTIDFSNPKVVRAGMGAHFNVPIIKTDWETIQVQTNHAQVWVADAAAGIPYDRVNWQPDASIIIGGEAEGARKREGATSIHIPMASGTESLNAAIACGVILFEVTRQRRNSL